MPSLQVLLHIVFQVTAILCKGEENVFRENSAGFILVRVWPSVRVYTDTGMEDAELENTMVSLLNQQQDKHKAGE